MKALETIVEGIKRNERRELCFLGDIHGGSSACSLSSLRKAVKYIEGNLSIRWVGMGDMIECIVSSDNRFDPDIIPKRYFTAWVDGKEPSPLKRLVRIQIKEITSILAPIARQCIGIHGGNHEDALSKSGTIDPLLEFIDELERRGGCEKPIENLGYGGCFHRINYRHEAGGSDTIIIHTQHGHQASIYDGATMNHLDRLFGNFNDVEVVVRGHSHKLFAKPAPTVGIPRRGKIKLLDVNRWGLASGSFLRTYPPEGAGYAEKWDRKPSPLGFAILELSFCPTHLNGRVQTFTAELADVA